MRHCHNHPLSGFAHLGPCERDAVGIRDTCCDQVLGSRAVGYGLEDKVVHIGIPRAAGAHGLHCNELSISFKLVEQSGILFPGGTADIDGVNRLETVDVGRIVHHTHIEYRMIAGTGCFGPETQLQGVDGEEVGVHTRQHGTLVVAIGAGSGGVVPIQTLGTAGRVVIGGGSTDIGVSARRRTVVETGPAVCKDRAGSGTSS